jgi:cell wall-associated NlpC family hydrolase
MNSYIGIPYTNRGRDREGVDCWGLVQLWYQEQLNITVDDYLYAYTAANDFESVSDAIKKHKKEWKAVDEPQFGDVLVFKIAGYPMHVGIKMHGDDFLHAFQGTQSCLERLSGIAWNRRLHEVYRWAS